MKCDEMNELIVPSIDGELSREEQERLDEHLAECRACRQEQETLAAFMKRVDGELAPLRAGMDEAREAILNKIKQPTLSPRMISSPGRVKEPGSFLRYFDVVNGLVAAYAGARRMFVEASPRTRRLPLAVAAVVVAAVCLWIAFQTKGTRYPMVEDVKAVTVEFEGVQKDLLKGEIPRAGSRIVVNPGGKLLLELGHGCQVEAAEGAVFVLTEEHGLKVEAGEVKVRPAGYEQEERIVKMGEEYVPSRE